MNASTQIQNDLCRSKSGLLREAQALRDQMDRLIYRLEAGGTANALDTLGSRAVQFEGALVETTTLQNVLFSLRAEEAEKPTNIPAEAETRPLTRVEARERFRREMEEDGFEVEEYEGRDFYSGPAVRVGDRDDIERIEEISSCRVRYDQMGLGFIVYPR